MCCHSEEALFPALVSCVLWGPAPSMVRGTGVESRLSRLHASQPGPVCDYSLRPSPLPSVLSTHRSPVPEPSSPRPLRVPQYLHSGSAPASLPLRHPSAQKVGSSSLAWKQEGPVDLQEALGWPQGPDLGRVLLAPESSPAGTLHPGVCFESGPGLVSCLCRAG